MSSILNVIRQAPTPTRHFTSLNVVSKGTKNSSQAAFNPEHHPIVLQQLVESISSNAYYTSGGADKNAKNLGPEATGAQSLSSSSQDALLAAARVSLSEMAPQQKFKN
ncbi:hypothetical protein BG004_002179 [Podila humilis]|nr:hypothetical protein BG004_002179 [Podila humilis]